MPNATNGADQRLDAGSTRRICRSRSLGAAAVSGSTAFLIGGTDANGADLNTILRANLAPAPPFFRLGLFGVTVPALSIKGEIGQQLGYIVAGGAGGGGLIS